MRKIVSAAACGAALLAGCGDASSSDDDTEPWRNVAASPLSPREFAIAVSLGDRVLVAGGSSADPCSPGAVCEPPTAASWMRDGAIYDAATEEWTQIAEAPIAPGLGVTTAVIGEVAYLLLLPPAPGEESTLLSYDTVSDMWDEHTPPPVHGELVGVDDELTVFASSHKTDDDTDEDDVGALPPDVVFDVDSDSWLELPTDPLGPSRDRKVIATDAGLVLLAKDLSPDPNADDPPKARAAELTSAGNLVDGQWSAMPDSDVFGTSDFFWTGELLVKPASTSSDADGSAGGILDPESGTWSDLPEHPDPDSLNQNLPVELYLSGEDIAFKGEWGLNVADMQWIKVPQHAVDSEEDDVDLPMTGYASAWVDTASGPAIFVWGGTWWGGWNSEDPSPGTLVGDGFVWQPLTES